MMTKQRFTILYETEENAMEWDLIDNQEDRLIVTGNGKAICDLLNELHEENQDLETKKEDAEYELLYLKEKYEEVIEENEQLKSQLYYDEEEGVCNICKHHYLIKDDESEFGYYNSRCKKGHYECARVSLKYCEDFEKELKIE